MNIPKFPLRAVSKSTADMEETSCQHQKPVEDDTQQLREKLVLEAEAALRRMNYEELQVAHAYLLAFAPAASAILELIIGRGTR